MESNKSESEVDFEINDTNCQKLVEQFVNLTQTDEALAQFYLQDRNWNLEISVNNYFEDISKQSLKRKSQLQTNHNNDNNDSSDSSDSDIAIISHSTHDSAKVAKTETIGDNSISSELNTSSSACDQLKDFRFITWNIDGLNERNIRIRTEAVCNKIKSENAIIVFLQEVIPSTESILRQNLPKYEFFSSNENAVDYYTLTLINKDLVKVESNQIIDFEETSMGRNLLKTRVTIGKTSLCLLNAHLESTKDFAETRINQLRKAFKEITAIPKTDTVIFAGDLNLRDKEVSKVSIPNGLVDVWIETGQRKEVQFTWDMMRNDNLLFEGKFKPRCRFDRVYFRQSTPPTVEAINFGLIGLERLKPHVCFPSDHWGVRCLFRFI